MKKTLVTAFVLVVLVQLAVPAKMIFDRETVLAEGEAFKFKTAPVDPNDPFRGKYVALQFRHDEVKISNKHTWKRGETVYAHLKPAADGFARVVAISKQKPDAAIPYLKTKVLYESTQNSDRTLHLDFPFDRFYMEESKAPEAEVIYNETFLEDDSDEGQLTYALVKISEGEAVLEDVLIDGVSLKQLVEERQKE
ncbi:MAG: GDYXXLXY domain-containing protein [Hymenobacteraceae bacterium]|nr:GDYXXLXY domain-containing protein [Hymenobacteraceae bacterium]MDX5395102.1 GDYXXLXY domain-containing protein [Hymenobacteraceae bacterium]MDX5443630.1 GDYXXLXY domain-containing protein [Hymenobacteraceae bacterium]MDX5511140.1 GDYXXLXY domain-containing protein [Hymenobacteraceae bacterium]